jgi:hypothetical protein
LRTRIFAPLRSRVQTSHLYNFMHKQNIFILQLPRRRQNFQNVAPAPFRHLPVTVEGCDALHQLHVAGAHFLTRVGPLKQKFFHDLDHTRRITGTESTLRF